MRAIARPTKLVRRGWETAIVCASGPSFTEEQAAVVAASRDRGVRVFVVNDNWKRVPTADVLYACDGRGYVNAKNPPQWWDVHIDAVRASGFAGELWTQSEPAARAYGLKLIRCARRPGAPREDYLIHSGGNSGFQAIGLAYLFGATRIALVGFDMFRRQDGKRHWFGVHEAESLRKESPWEVWIQAFADVARDFRSVGVRCVNCSTETAITAFERADLAATLEAWTATAVAA
jgi:hypothetical protein